MDLNFWPGYFLRNVSQEVPARVDMVVVPDGEWGNSISLSPPVVESCFVGDGMEQTHLHFHFLALFTCIIHAHRIYA